MIELVLGDETFTQAICFLAKFPSVTGQPRESGSPVRQGELVRDQADNVKSRANEPFVLGMDTKPAESNGIGNDTQDNQDVRSERAKVRK